MSLMGGWLPVTVQLVAVIALVLSLRRRSQRWTSVMLPAVAASALLVALAAHWLLQSQGLASEPAPWHLWLWVALTALAAGVALTGWPGDRWSRRNLCVFATSMCLLGTGLNVNGWIGYFPTTQGAWNQLSGAALDAEVDWPTALARQRGAMRSDNGAVVRVDIDAEASGFRHRPEYVYLPPAWFASDPPPQLPTVMMIGGQFNTPADWVRAGDAVRTLDAFADAHGGFAPVAVFVDSTGGFLNDTECVNGPRGNAADHLTKDVVPHLVSRFAVRPDRAGWAVAGFSTGGTCAVDLAVMHPDMFGAFVDIAGDVGPNTGTKDQTIDRLYGGDAAAWSEFDPTTVMTRHGQFTDLAGVFVVPDASPGDSDGAHALCDVGADHGIECRVVPLPGRHVWPFGSTAFAATLPWLAGEIGTPGAKPVAIPSPDP